MLLRLALAPLLLAPQTASSLLPPLVELLPEFAMSPRLALETARPVLPTLSTLAPLADLLPVLAI